MLNNKIKLYALFRFNSVAYIFLNISLALLQLFTLNFILFFFLIYNKELYGFDKAKFNFLKIKNKSSDDTHKNWVFKNKN